MSFNSNRNSRDGKPNRMNKPNNEKKFSKDRGPRGAGSSSSSSRETSNRSFDKDRKSEKDFKPRDRFPKKEDKQFSDRKPFTTDRPSRPNTEGKFSDKSERGDRRSSDRKPFNNDRTAGPKSEGKFTARSERGDRRPSDRKPFNSDKTQRSTEGRFSQRDDRRPSDRKPWEDNKDRNQDKGRPTDTNSPRSDKPYPRKENDRSKSPRKRNDGGAARSSSPSKGIEHEEMRLNRYIANAGVCSRRKADELIAAGVVTVNGEVITSLGTKVNPATDDVRYNGERLKREKMVYVLLNKPKDYITTTEDPQERRTVMHLVEKASHERIYPVGRLDRNTTGLLLMTNDGSLAEKLSHPRNSVTKIYHVELDKNLSQGDLNKIQFGLELEDGIIKPDEVSYVQGASKREVGIQIHSGKNRIVRRIFESLGYSVVKLDRVIYANLTKKDLPRGRWRYLDEREVIQLKHFMK